MLEKQKEEAGERRFATVFFDNCYEFLNDQIDICSVRSITKKEYYRPDREGTRVKYEVMSDAISSYCTSRAIAVGTLDGIRRE